MTLRRVKDVVVEGTNLKMRTSLPYASMGVQRAHTKAQMDNTFMLAKTVKLENSVQTMVQVPAVHVQEAGTATKQVFLPVKSAKQVDTVTVIF